MGGPSSNYIESSSVSIPLEIETWTVSSGRTQCHNNLELLFFFKEPIEDLYVSSRCRGEHQLGARLVIFDFLVSPRVRALKKVCEGRAHSKCCLSPWEHC